MSETNGAANKEYKNMNASEKTAHLGFKHFSERELNERQRAAEARRIIMFRELLQRFLDIPELRLGKHITEEQLKAVFAEPINLYYDWAVKEGFTGNDIKATVDNVIMIAGFLDRAFKQVGFEEVRFNYGYSGENDLADLPVRELMKLADEALKTRPAEPVYDETPEQVVDALPADEGRVTLDDLKYGGAA